MSSYVLQTRTMPQSAPKKPSLNLEAPVRRDLESKPQLPSKRKRDGLCGLGDFTKPFIVKPCPDSPYDKPATFNPIRIIGRAQLPLTFLDTSASEFSPNRLFAAYIDVLEQHYVSQDKDSLSPRVLIARYESDKMLYAIERVEPRVYSLCKLAGWLKEKDVAELWDPSNLRQYPTFSGLNRSDMNSGEWWQRAVVQLEPGEMPKKRARISMLRTKPEPTELDRSSKQPIPPIVESTVPEADIIHVPEIHMEPPSPQQLLENLIQQYLNEVYITKTSLAYFVKGPITRLRTAFTSPEEGSPPTYELIAFLRSMLLSHKASEKKYREKLPEIIKSIPPGSLSDDEQADGAPKAKKSKKKMKLNREGVYPQEDVIVKRWWISEMPNVETYGEETVDQRIKRRVGELRVRETLAQMILILEIIALEALSTYKEPAEEDQANAGDMEAQHGSQSKPTKRKRKMNDMRLVLDLLLDKLCIWQSVDQDGILDFDAKSSKHENGADSLGKASSSDRLQGFCREVIIPFYMSRLSEQAAMINKKLGGPAPASPSKRKAMKPPTSHKSGEAKEPDTKKSRRLARVATDTTAQTGQRRATPSLNRSITDSTLLNGIKREGSEVPLGVIPFQRSPSNAARRSMSHFQLLKGREIDVNTTSAAASAKLKQKKRVEEEVKEAISALRKPNRGLAAGTYADDIERRGLGSTSKSKKAAARKIVKDVQVSATPHAIRRTKNMERTPFHNPFRDQEVPSSSLRIPSSGAHQAVPGTVQRPTASRGIAETPSKMASDKSNLTSAGPARRIIFATPMKNRTVASSDTSTAIFSTPVRGTPAQGMAPSPPALAVSVTPIKERTATGDVPRPVFETPAKGIEEPSDLFAQLGWDDDDIL